MVIAKIFDRNKVIYSMQCIFRFFGGIISKMRCRTDHHADCNDNIISVASGIPGVASKWEKASKKEQSQAAMPPNAPEQNQTCLSETCSYSKQDS